MPAVKKSKSANSKSVKKAKLVKPAKKLVAKNKKATSGKWPNEREVFFRPNRKKYVRKMIKDDGCVFCRTSANPASLQTLCVYKSKHSQIVLNKFPYNSGHILVLPLRHGGNILELAAEEYADLNDTLRLAVEAVQNIYQPAGFNLGMNHGASGGAGIPDHLHYHIVPRWHGDVNFFPLIAETKVVIETLEDSYKNFIDYFNQKAVT